MDGLLDPSGGVLKAFATTALVGATVSGAFETQLAGMTAAHMAANPESTPLQSGQAAFLQFVAATLDTTSDANLKLAGFPFLQMGSKNPTMTTPANLGASSSDIAAEIWSSQPTAAHQLFVGGAANIQAQAAVVGSLLKSTLATPSSGAIATLQGQIKAASGINAYVLIGMSTDPRFAAIFDTLTIGTLMTRMVTAGATATGGKYSMASAQAIAAWIGGLLTYPDGNAPFFIKGGLGATMANFFFCPEGAGKCTTTSSSDVAAAQWMYGNVLPILGLGVDDAGQPVAAGGKSSLRNFAKKELTSMPAITFKTEFYHQTAKSGLWVNKLQAGLTVLQDLRGAKSLASTAAAVNGAAAAYLTQVGEGMKAQAAAGVAAAPASAAAAAAVKMAEGAAAMLVAKIPEVQAPINLAFGGAQTFVPVAGGVVAAKLTMFTLAEVADATNALLNAFLYEKMFQICAGMDAQFTPLGVPSICPTLTGALTGIAGGLTTGQMADIATYLAVDITKDMFEKQLMGYAMSGPFVTRSAKDMLFKEGGFAEPVWSSLAPLIGQSPMTATILNGARGDPKAAPTDKEVKALSDANKAGCPNSPASLGQVAPKDCLARPALFGTFSSRMGNTATTFHNRGHVVKIDGMEVMAGKCEGGCWNAKAPLMTKTVNGTNELLKIGHVETGANAWSTGGVSPRMKLIEEVFPPVEGQVSPMSLDMSANIYVGQAKRTLKFDFKENVKDPSGKLHLRRFETKIAGEGAYWKTDADAALHSAGVKCLLDVAEFSGAPALLGKPHLLECLKADTDKSTTYTVPTWESGSAARDVGTWVDMEPHTGMAVCANERLGAYLVFDPKLTAVLFGGACGKPGMESYPASLTGCLTAKSIIVPYYWAKRLPCVGAAQALSFSNNFALVKQMQGPATKALLVVGVVLLIAGLALFVKGAMTDGPDSKTTQG
jgi:hypothetical protein